MSIIKEDADKYQGLFNLMSKDHNLTLTISEMDEYFNNLISYPHFTDKEIEAIIEINI